MEANEIPTESPDESSSDALFRTRRRCCCFPCFDSNSTVGLKWWQKVRTTEIESDDKPVWSRGVAALKKIREWSELAAGPRWKTFIRRFNRNRNNNNKHANFQYDPLSYAMNFDEGPGQNGHFDADEDEEDFFHSRNFSSRYAKGSMDLGKDGPTFA